MERDRNDGIPHRDPVDGANRKAAVVLLTREHPGRTE